MSRYTLFSCSPIDLPPTFNLGRNVSFQFLFFILSDLTDFLIESFYYAVIFLHTNRSL